MAILNRCKFSYAFSTANLENVHFSAQWSMFSQAPIYIGTDRLHDKISKCSPAAPHCMFSQAPIHIGAIDYMIKYQNVYLRRYSVYSWYYQFILAPSNNMITDPNVSLRRHSVSSLKHQFILVPINYMIKYQNFSPAALLCIFSILSNYIGAVT